MEAAATTPSNAADVLADAIDRRGEGAMFIGAHPDDETFAMGGQLGRLPLMRVVIVTDGAPQDLRDAQKVGFSSAEAYAEARANEMRAALAEAGMAAERLLMLGISDQRTAFELVTVSRRLAELLEEFGPQTIFTHSYEGGHPDHDAVAFAVHAAVALAARSLAPPVIVEMPYYRGGPDGTVVQSFGSEWPEAVVVDLDDDAFAHKNRIMSRHDSQRRLFGGTGFRSRREQFRIAARYDFDEPPNEGRVLYESWRLGITGPEWMERARAALQALRLVG